jgi:hypothetical protein
VCCGTPKSRRSYRGHGLCWRCYKREQDHRRWQVEALRQKVGQHWANQALLEVIQVRGVLVTAREIGAECVSVRGWVRTPSNPNPDALPEAVAIAVVRVWLEVQGG